jgi:hypothetical protein
MPKSSRSPATPSAREADANSSPGCPRPRPNKPKTNLRGQFSIDDRGSRFTDIDTGSGRLEGTGSFAAELAGELAPAGEDVVEVGSLRRARGSKNDRLDAVRATRTAAAREHQSSPRVRGLRQAIRALAGHPSAAAVDRRITTLTLQPTTARIRFLTGQLADIDPELARLIHAHPAGPALLAESGVGPVVADQLLITWSHPGRVRSEAHSPRWPESRRWKPAAATAPDTASTAETGR